MNGEAVDQPAETEDEPQENGETDASKPTRKVTLSYEKYRRIANTLVLFLRQEEDKPMTGSMIICPSELPSFFKKYFICKVVKIANSERFYFY